MLPFLWVAWENYEDGSVGMHMGGRVGVVATGCAAASEVFSSERMIHGVKLISSES